VNGVLELLRERGVLSDLDWHFAHTVARIGGERHPVVLLAAALASHAIGQGHVCLDLPRLVAGGALIDDAGVAVDCEWPELHAWVRALHDSPLVTAVDDTTLRPLVLDAAGRLYLRRYWSYQERLARAIHRRALEEAADVDAAHLREGLVRLFPADGEGGDEPDWQRVAALVAVLRRFCIISGGPGTGKTYAVVRILALLTEQALVAGRRPPRVTLLAPTGKAAARLKESIAEGKARLPCAAAVAAAIPEEAATIHRGLGAIPGYSARFRHGPDHPLDADVVLVDEASMVDLAMMARLVDATPPQARLILLGDQDQLASVEAGAVLGDLCNTGAPHGFSRAFVERAGQLGERLPQAANAPVVTGLGDCIVSLTRGYRYRADSAIGGLARAINAGDLPAVEAALAVGDGVGRIDPAPDGRLGTRLERAIRDGFAPYFATSDPVDRLRALERFRVLCAHRRGPSGVETINARIEALLALGGYIRPDATFYPGRPILVTRNDYALQLFNGDVGTIVADPERSGGMVAVFLGPGGAPRRIAPSRLPPHETVFATSVHKGQGSEFDAVAVLIPDQASPLITRELLYTAITRARSRAEVYGSREMVAYAVAHRSERASGLREALWGCQSTAGGR
jgi:exodeoxyribonuclease V alpha subunit